MQMDDEISARWDKKNFMLGRWFEKVLSLCGELPNNYICVDRIWPNGLQGELQTLQSGEEIVHIMSSLTTY